MAVVQDHGAERAMNAIEYRGQQRRRVWTEVALAVVLLLIFLADAYALYQVHVQCMGQRPRLLPLLALFSMTTLVLWSDARLRLPLHPLLAIAAAFGPTIAYDRTKAWAQRKPWTQEEATTPAMEARP